MLNIEQILIKTAQYFDLALKKLAIERSAEKTRLYKRQLTKETIDHIINKIYQEIDSLEVTPSLKKLIDEFIEHYTYISEQLYITFNEKREKELDWLLLKHFVIPFFAVRIAQNFAEYNDRIDKGLPGGDFWYLPSHSESSDKLKIIFPINKVMRWLIDLYGGSNQKFYFDKKSDYDKGFSAATLKDWHDNFVTPKLQTIKDFASIKFKYDGVFRNDREVSIEEQFLSVMEFVKSKLLSIEELKLEVPNFNNMLDRLHFDTLSVEEKERFILYIEQRWSEPKAKQIEYVLTVSRAAQACYKELCKYFDVDKNAINIDDNHVIQLTALFSHIHNTVLDLESDIESEISILFQPYIYSIWNIAHNKKEALDEIIASISVEMEHEHFQYRLDEIVILVSSDEKNRQKAYESLEYKKQIKAIETERNNQTYTALNFINTTEDEEKILEYIYSIKDSVILHNLGDYYEGNNYLTNEPPMQNLPLALTIHIIYSRVAQEHLHMLNAYHKVLNLLTFSYYPRALGKEDVEEWLIELARISNKNDSRSMLLLLAHRAYHQINQNNESKATFLIEEFESKTRDIKPEEYSLQLLFVAQDYMLKIGNTTLYNKLKKRNERDPHFNGHMQGEFYFYK